MRVAPAYGRLLQRWPPAEPRGPLALAAVGQEAREGARGAGTSGAGGAAEAAGEALELYEDHQGLRHREARLGEMKGGGLWRWLLRLRGGLGCWKGLEMDSKRDK